MAKRNIIVIGASSGGFSVIRELIRSLPGDIEAAIFIVWHMAPDIEGILPQSLNKLSTLHAANAIDHEPIVNGRIYVAPPDRHLLLEKNEVRVTRGPKENRFRPAVDPLFRSAAYVFGARVIGIILSGALDDGTAGLWSIKQRGGIAIVQHPAEAEVPGMPESALREVNVDYTLRTSEMGPLLTKLVQTEADQESEQQYGLKERTQMEIDIAMGKNPDYNDMMQFGEWSPYTCPECHGVLSVFKDGNKPRYRCHTGHAFSIESLLSAFTEMIEVNLWSTVRNMQESVILLNNLGDHYAEKNKPKEAAVYFKKAREMANRIQMVRLAIFQQERLPPDTVSPQPKKEVPG